jgi:hypothetical protein
MERFQLQRLRFLPRRLSHVNAHVMAQSKTREGVRVP